jgi:hypothetical protein
VSSYRDISIYYRTSITDTTQRTINCGKTARSAAAHRVFTGDTMVWARVRLGAEPDCTEGGQDLREAPGPGACGCRYARLVIALAEGLDENERQMASVAKRQNAERGTLPSATF